MCYQRTRAYELTIPALMGTNYTATEVEGVYLLVGLGCLLLAEVKCSQSDKLVGGVVFTFK